MVTYAFAAVLAAIALGVAAAEPSASEAASKARALIDDGRFLEAERTLAPLLGVANPDADILRLSIEANEAAGRWITAGRRMDALLAVTRSADPERVWRAAMFARRLGQVAKERERYRRFVRLVDKPDERTDLAFRRLLGTGAHVDVYERFVAFHGHHDQAWEYGIAAWDRLRKTYDGEPILKLSELMLRTFPDPERNRLMGWRLYEDARRTLFGPDSWRRAFALLTSHPVHDPGLKHSLLSQLGWEPEFVVRGVAAGPTPARRDTLDQTHLFAKVADEARRLALGRAYLACEPLYRDQEDPKHYSDHLRQILNLPSVFRIEGKELVSVDDAKARFESLVARKADTEELRQRGRQFINTCGATPEARLAFVRKYPQLVYADQLHYGFGPENAQFDDIVQRSGNSLATRLSLLGYYRRAEDKATVLATVRETFARWPATYDGDHIGANVLAVRAGVDMLTVDEKLGLLREAYDASGYKGPFEKLLARAQTSPDLKDHEPFKTWVAGLDKKKIAVDPLAAACVELHQLPANPSKPAKGVHAAVERAFKAYGAKYPAGVDPVRDALMRDIIYRYWHNHVWSHVGGVKRAAAITAPWLGPTDEVWAMIVRRLRDHRVHVEVYPTIVKDYLAVVDAGWSGSEAAWHSFAETPVAKGDAASPLAKHYKSLTPAACWNHHAMLYHKADAQTYLDELDRMVQAGAVAQWETSWLENATQWTWTRIQAEKLKPSERILQAYWDVLLTGRDPEGRQDDSNVLRFYPWIGKRDEMARKYIGEGRTPRARAQRFMYFYQQFQALYPELNPDDAADVAPVHRVGLWNTCLLPELKKMSGPDFEDLWVSSSFIIHLEAALRRDAAPGVEGLRNRMAAAYRHGAMPTAADAYYAWPMFAPVLREAVEKKDWDVAYRQAVGLAGWPAQTGHYASIRDTQVGKMIDAMEGADAWELAYALANGILAQENVPEEVAAWLQSARARSARRIPGLYPVGEEDRAYPLFAAADEWSAGNFARAWELTRNRLPLLEANRFKLDTSYMAWVIDQMRLQKNLDAARKLAITMLIREHSLAPVDAAAIRLTKADIYRDMRNFEAARIEYDSLRRNDRYAETPSARLAESRMLELRIRTGDYEGAGEIIERWRTHSQLEKRAQAYFFLGLIAFERKEYEEARASLRQVFELDPSHTEARLLEGELKARTGKGVGEPEIPVGRRGDREYIVPGRQLTVTMTDRNLAVVKQGQSVPVVVSTTVGGDEEHLNLYPGASNPFQFRATIATALGKASPSNNVLEIMGSDLVRYRIHPDFEKAHELVAHEPKELRVLDDARLAASAGRILTEKEEAEQALAAQSPVRDRSRSHYGRAGSIVRPGNAIYVLVRDRDRDMTDDPDSVYVRVATASGDVIDRVALTETEPHSGVFRGEVASGLPPPRALASDSAVGSDPAVLINSARTGLWESTVGGESKKWVEVDTMSSHQISRVELEMPSPETVRALTLWGSLGEAGHPCGRFPSARDTAGGVVYQVVYSTSDHVPDVIRTACRRVGATLGPFPEPNFSRELTGFKGKNGWMIARIAGEFYLDAPRTLEMKFIHEKVQENWQWAYLFIDGKRVMGGEMLAKTLATQEPSSVRLAAGLHAYELLVRDHWEHSTVVVGIRQADGAYAPIPEEWFSIHGTPAWAEAQRRKANIERTERGFVASFAEPRRLRRLRWTFDEAEGQSVSASRFRIVDAAGHDVVPAAVDFTSATTNSTLEITPGDRVSITYADELRTTNAPPTRHAALSSMYYNGKIEVANETVEADPRGRMIVETDPAIRFRVGDQVVVIVTEYDKDETEKADTVEVEVSTAQGESLTLRALEHVRRGTSPDAVHSGEFRAVLKFGTATGNHTIKVGEDDVVMVRYLDRENTDPGVPIHREAVVVEAGTSVPRISPYATRMVRVEDRSERARELLRQMELRGEDVAGLTIYRDEPAASRVREPTDEPVRVSMHVPLLFDVTYPSLARHLRSTVTAQVVSAKELAAAQAEGRAPAGLDVPLVLRPIGHRARTLGYAVRDVPGEAEEEILHLGRFCGVVRLQMGNPGDPIDDLVRNDSDMAVFDGPSQALRRVPTLLISGPEQLHIRVQDVDTGEWHARPLQLVSDARIDLLDDSYTAARPAVHLGQKFFVRVVDPDRNATSELDSITVSVTSSNTGDTVELTLLETMPHAGEFTGAILPRLPRAEPPAVVPPPGGAAPAEAAPPGTTAEDGSAGEPAPIDEEDVAAGPTVDAEFGDELTFVYVDEQTLQGTPATNRALGKIHLGADAAVGSFTKSFQDPDMAVKVRFLRAEALFEMAKEHYKLKNIERSRDLIAEGKIILDEALREHPNTSLISQGRYLLANLSQELARVEEDQNEQRRLYNEAIGRYANIVSTWPDSDFAPQAQFKMGVSLEKIEDYDRATEEYVKLTYTWPDHQLVPDATIRLANHYYNRGDFEIAAKVFSSFCTRYEANPLAPKALFLSAQCFIRRANAIREAQPKSTAWVDSYQEAIRALDRLLEAYPDENALCAEAMYWLGDSYFKTGKTKESYISFKKLTWDYPRTRWAKLARGYLTDEKFSRVEVE